MREEQTLAEETVRRGLLLRTTMEILRDAGRKFPPVEVLKELGHRIQLNTHELSLDNSGLPRYERAVGWETLGAVTVGWMSKMGGWSITEAGIEALETYPTVDQLSAELALRYREIDQRRKQAQESLSELQQFIATALLLVEPGRWTAHDDLAALAGTTGNEVAHFLASVSIKLANAYRVLNHDGSIPPEGMLNATYRGTDLRRRLTAEGLDFDSQGRASQDQRLTADALRELLEARAQDDLTGRTPARRAWMVRGSNVEGYNLVEEWLREGFVSLSASQLAHLSPDVSYDELKRTVEASYQHKSYAYRAQRLEEVDRFLRRMQVGDLILTSLQGEVYLGEVSGRARFADSTAPHSNLRRDVTWLNLDDPAEIGGLRAPVPALLQSQAYVVDLTEAYEQLAELVPRAVAVPVAVPEPVKRELAFNPITAAFAEDMLLGQTDLEQIADLLWERKQIILYGPPGTGKTYLATKLARHLTEDGAVKLVQFHPSYTYEDFFEGFRPEPGGSGTLTFELRAGPFRDFAEVATANPSTAYILIIDEINRANLAKVFGELYFLLEYRDESISLQYSPDREFTLPQNLFIIGTMNTADRSIARIDAAMRRRFLFVELDPRIPPVHGLLSRWLDSRGLPQDAALLLDALNRRIEDADAAIGPSYLMDERIYQRPDGLNRVWTYSIMPLLRDLFYGQDDLEERYGLASLRRSRPAPPMQP
jgi:5-methylcytosine-specific restriction protein B